MTSKDKIVIKFIEDEGFDCIFYLPCSTMKNILEYFDNNNNSISLIPINREEEGVGLIAGMHLSGSKPLLMIQDSGLGNSYNAIVSLLVLYKIGILIVATIRGYIGEISTPNTIWAEKTSRIHESIGLKEYVLDTALNLDFWSETLSGAMFDVKTNHRPVIVKINLSSKSSYHV